MDTLALLGGKAAIKAEKRGEWPTIHKRDIETVASVLRDGDFSGRSSSRVLSAERGIKEYLEVKHFSLFSSGTASLHAALIGCGVSTGDEVVVPALTFAATAMAVKHVGATPIFCDVNPRTFCSGWEEISKKITRRTKAVVVVHFQGLPADVIQIVRFAAQKGIYVIEDCA